MQIKKLLRKNRVQLALLMKWNLPFHKKGGNVVILVAIIGTLFLPAVKGNSLDQDSLRQLFATSMNDCAKVKTAKLWSRALKKSGDYRKSAFVLHRVYLNVNDGTVKNCDLRAQLLF